MPALNDDDLKKLRKALAFLAGKSPEDRSNRLYYMGRQVLTHMGLAVPAAMRQLEVVINWPRVVVDTIEERQDVKSILVPQDEGAADTLRRLYDANDLESELSSWKRDRLIYGRGFLSVGANEEDPSTPILQVESPTQMCVKIDRRHRRVAYAVRLLKSEETEEPDIATLYTPDYTVIARNRGGIWTEEDRDDHKLGVVPVFPSFNRRMTGEYVGQTEMADVIPLTDAALRTMTNLQVAVEALAVPKRWIFGIKQGDFASLDGWFNHLQPFLAHANANAKAGQFAAADLKNFHSTLESYGKLCASVTGFPARYFGMTTANPPAEGAIIAEEAQKKINAASSVLQEKYEHLNEKIQSVGQMGFGSATGMAFSGRGFQYKGTDLKENLWYGVDLGLNGLALGGALAALFSTGVAAVITIPVIIGFAALKHIKGKEERIAKAKATAKDLFAEQERKITYKLIEKLNELDLVGKVRTKTYDKFSQTVEQHSRATQEIGVVVKDLRHFFGVK